MTYYEMVVASIQQRLILREKLDYTMLCLICYTILKLISTIYLFYNGAYQDQFVAEEKYIDCFYKPLNFFIISMGSTCTEFDNTNQFIKP